MAWWDALSLSVLMRQQLEPEPEADPQVCSRGCGDASGDFAAARTEFDKLLQANPNDAEAQAGKAQAGLFARAALLDPKSTLAAADDSDDMDSQLAAADVEMITGQAEAAFRRLLGLITRLSGEQRNRAGYAYWSFSRRLATPMSGS